MALAFHMPPTAFDLCLRYELSSLLPYLCYIIPPTTMAETFPEVQGGGSLILAWQVKNKKVLVIGGGEVCTYLTPPTDIRVLTLTSQHRSPPDES